MKYMHGSAFQAAICIGIAGCIYLLLILISRVLGPKLGYFGISDCSGTVTFNARLIQVHYETLIVLFVCILAELGTLGIMLHYLIKAIRLRTKT